MHQGRRVAQQPAKQSRPARRRRPARGEKELPSYMRSTAATRLWKSSTEAEKRKPKGQRTELPSAPRENVNERDVLRVICNTERYIIELFTKKQKQKVQYTVYRSTGVPGRVGYLFLSCVQ